MPRIWPAMIIILNLFAGTPALAQLAKTQEQKFTEIVQKFVDPNAVAYMRTNPQFKCWHIGRLQAYSDVLRVSGNPLFVKADHLVGRNTEDCDPSFTSDFKLQAEGDLPRKILLLVKRLNNGVALEDIVPACFNVGRLSILTNRLSEFLRENSADGHKANIKYHALYKRSAAEVKKRYKDCEATAMY